jgi:GT2 family glycosyltransferase
LSIEQEAVPSPAAEPPMSSAATNSISVVICAYTEDRWHDVLAAVTSVRTQRPAPHEVVVVVDHNEALLRRLRCHLTGTEVRVVPNTGERGLSGGKNTGVAATTGDIVAFLDDDAVAEPGWTRSLVEAFVDGDVLGVGGLTLPAWATRRPDWWPPEFDWVVGCTFVGREPGVVRNLLGGNASFRRDVFRVAGGFPTHIGRSSRHSRPLGCEETEFCIRAGTHLPTGRFIFNPRAVIHHKVPANRERFAYFRSRCYAEGLSKALVTESVGVGRGLAAEVTYTRRTLRRGIIRGIRSGLSGDRRGVLRAGTILIGLVCTASGYAIGSLRGRAWNTRSSR